MKAIVFALICFSLEALVWQTPDAYSSTSVLNSQRSTVTTRLNSIRSSIDRIVGHQDAAMLVDPDGKEIYSYNKNKLLVPASTLKVVTALVALYYLGEPYRFVTEFYLDTQNNLKVKGYGDPFLVSEAIQEIAQRLRGKLLLYNDLILDETYFQRPILIPGRHRSTQPYDAPNGALCVNFNTVYFKKRNGVYLSAEEQTPLLPLALEKIRGSGLNQGRIVLSSRKEDILQYAGELMGHFLTQQGIRSTGRIRPGKVETARDTLILRYRSNLETHEVLSRLLEFSNNFIANQLLIAIGAQVYEAPGTLEKGLRAARAYIHTELKIEDVRIVEGSGISRKNRISAATMMQILAAFEHHHQLMRKKGREYFKSGHLRGIRTRVGYIKDPGGRHYRFVVIINTPGKTTAPVMRAIHSYIE
jgi:D-alanyl-D-alanine carboxypeptidase/D-alanyl-D-alanine-endopeptidase (penicillin-binding protein 4)